MADAGQTRRRDQPDVPSPDDRNLHARCSFARMCLATGDVGQALGGPAEVVVAAAHRAPGVVVDPDAVLAVGAQVALVAGDLVAPAPAGRLDMDLEAVPGPEAAAGPLYLPAFA